MRARASASRVVDTPKLGNGALLIFRLLRLLCSMFACCRHATYKTGVLPVLLEGTQKDSAEEAVVCNVDVRGNPRAFLSNVTQDIECLFHVIKIVAGSPVAASVKLTDESR